MVSGVTQIVSKNVLAYAKTIYNCTTITGVKFENDGGSGTAGAHWEKSWIDNEMMSGSISTGSVYISKLTLKFMEDSGWYLP